MGILTANIPSDCECVRPPESNAIHCLNVAHPPRRIIRVHMPQSRGDLLRRPAQVEQLCVDALVRVRSLDQPAPPHAPLATQTLVRPRHPAAADLSIGEAAAR